MKWFQSHNAAVWEPGLYLLFRNSLVIPDGDYFRQEFIQDGKKVILEIAEDDTGRNAC